jgi:signal transduction histidine kinase
MKPIDDMSDLLQRLDISDQPLPPPDNPSSPYATLRDAAAPRAAALAREELLACIAHDLRTPLSVISLSAAVLSRSAISKPHAQAVRRIADSAEMIKNLISDLLNESRPLEGQAKLELRSMMSNALVAGALRIMQPIADASRVHLVAKLQAKPEPVLIDQQRMLRVFANLVGNAIKFSAVDSSVTVTLESPPEGVRFSIADTGPGIAAADLGHLFERFWRASSQASVEGAGLGLPIVKRIIEAHGGVIGVASEPGVGTTFHFTLPRAAMPAPQAAKTLDRAPNHQ